MKLEKSGFSMVEWLIIVVIIICLTPLCQNIQEQLEAQSNPAMFQEALKTKPYVVAVINDREFTFDLRNVMAGQRPDIYRAMDVIVNNGTIKPTQSATIDMIYVRKAARLGLKRMPGYRILGPLRQEDSLTALDVTTTTPSTTAQTRPPYTPALTPPASPTPNTTWTTAILWSLAFSVSLIALATWVARRRPAITRRPSSHSDGVDIDSI